MNLIYPTSEEKSEVVVNTPLVNLCKDEKLNNILSHQRNENSVANHFSLTNNPKDDFTKIFGIGRAFEEKLYKAQIFTYSQLCIKSKAFLKNLLNPYGTFSIDYDRILEEARVLSKDPVKVENINSEETFKVSEKIIEAFNNSSINKSVSFQVVLQLIENSVNVQDYCKPTKPEEAKFVLGNLTLIPKTKDIIVNAQEAIDFEEYDEIVIWKNSDERFLPSEYMYDMVFIDTKNEGFLESSFVIDKNAISDNNGLLLNN